MKIAVIDYGMGNLRSVEKALQLVGAKAVVTSDPAVIKKADKIVFPGVGAFGEAMEELKRRGLVEPIKNAIEDGKYFLGLCLGLQLLFNKSEEARGVKGLGLLEGEVKRFHFERSPLRSGRIGFQTEKLKIPHMGWNTIDKTTRGRKDRIFKGVPDRSYVYFVHSYYVKPLDPKIAITTTGYGMKFVSGVCKDNIYGLQFHPEKSQELGLEILKNFVGRK